jgi:UrcA family protein
MKAMLTAAAAGIIAASLATGASADASWSKDPTATERVRYADLDLSSAAGQRRLKDRISYAAYRLCLVEAPASPTPAIADPVCFRKAKNEGLAQMERAVAAATSSYRVASTSQPQH